MNSFLNLTGLGAFGASDPDLPSYLIEVKTTSTKKPCSTLPVSQAADNVIKGCDKILNTSMTTPIDQATKNLYDHSIELLDNSYTAFINDEAAKARGYLTNLHEHVTILLRHWDRVLVEQDEKESTSDFLRLQLAGLQNWLQNRLKNETDPTRRCVVASRIEEVKQELARIETL